MCVHAKSLQSFFATPWTVAHWAPLSMVFSRPEYWSGLPCPPPGDLPNPAPVNHLVAMMLACPLAAKSSQDSGRGTPPRRQPLELAADGSHRCHGNPGLVICDPPEPVCCVCCVFAAQRPGRHAREVPDFSTGLCTFSLLPCQTSFL